MLNCNSSAWSANLPLEACFLVALHNANVFGPIRISAQNGAAPYSHNIKIQIPSQSRTIVLTGTDLTAAPLTVTDSAGITSAVNGPLGDFSLDRYANNIYPGEQVIVMVTTTDAQGNIDTDMVTYNS